MSPEGVATLAIPGTLLIALALWAGVRRAGALLALPPSERKALLVETGALLCVWLALAGWLGARGVFRTTSESTFPAVALGLMLPVAIGAAIVAASGRARDILSATPPHLLIGVQVYRVLGGIFLILYAQRRIPGAFALPAGWGDVLIGATAPIVAGLYRSDPARWRGLAIGWNLVGLADLGLAVTLGVLTAPGRLQRLALEAPNVLISSFPLVLIPTVLVPLSILLHLFSLWRLRRGEA